MHLNAEVNSVRPESQSFMSGIGPTEEPAIYEVIHARLEDIPVLQKLLAEGVPECLALYTIWSSTKLQPYLQTLICGQSSRDVFYLLCAGETVAAVVYLRVVDNSVWINNVVVDANYRGHGLGSYLLAKAVQWHGELHGCSLVGWESIVDDERWHRHLGGTLKGYRSAWLGPLPSEPHSLHAFARFEELPKAWQDYEMYGFSNFWVRTQTKRYQVGRLGDSYLRLLDTEGLRDPDLLTSLSWLDRGRQLLIFADDNDSEIDRNYFRKVATLVHFESPMNEFIQRCIAAVGQRPGVTETKKKY